MNPNVSALVGTIENHPESTSESDTGSFTLTRQQRPQPQVGSKRRPRAEKHLKTQEKLRQDLNNSLRLTEQQIEHLNNSIRMNEARLNERNDSRDRLNDSRINDSRVNESRLNDSRVNDSRINDSRNNDSRLNDSRVNDSRLNDSRLIDSRVDSRLNDSRINDSRVNDQRIDRELNDSRLEDRRMSDLNASIRLESPRSHVSPLRRSPKEKEPRQESTKEFFAISPLSPSTEDTLLSDDERQDQVYSNEPETSKCLGPDSQYEPVREEKEEVLKTNHHHCYSDTNTMDSGWQSGSEKQVTD